MSLTQRRILMKVFIEGKFDYCLLVWMFYGRMLNRKINHVHEYSLQSVNGDNKSFFHELLQKDHSFTIHHRNIQSLAIELYKTNYLRVRSLVVSDLRSETKGSQFESGC